MQEQYLEKAIEIIKTLNDFTYQAYLIGGVVRDYIMHNEFNDIDICTSATPEQVQALFPEVRMEYAHLGFVTLKVDDMSFEISTFKEEVYEGHRKPSKIYYAQTLVEDVKRRDFTINALALTDKYQVVDLVKGQKDIKHKTIRIIGKGRKRFKEDPLRILRAYNLVGRFNFRIATGTEYAIMATNKYLKEISNYQISRELHKIITSKYGKRAVKTLVDLKTNEHLKDYEKGLYIISRHFKKFDLIEKFALCYAVNNQIPEHTCFDKATLTKIQSILKCVEATKDINPKNDINLTVKDVFNYGVDLLLSASKINYYLRNKYPKLAKTIKNLDEKLPIHSISEMKFHGSDITDLNNGETGPYIKDIMEQLSTEVILGMVENNHKALKTRAVELLEEYKDKEHGIVTDPHEVVTEEEKVVENTNNELINLKVRFDIEYTELLKSNLASFVKGDETPEQLEELEKTISHGIKEGLINQNPEYKLLEEKGLI